MKTFHLILFIFLWNKIKGDTLPICSKSTEQSFETKDSKNYHDNIHVGILPPANNDIELELSHDKKWLNRMNEFELYQCAIQLEACSYCLIGIVFEPIMAHFSEFQMQKFSRCGETSAAILEPCFKLEFLEQSADQNGVTNGFMLNSSDIYRRQSIWEKPESNHFNSSGNSLIVLVTMKNIASERQLFNYYLRNFPMKAHVYSNEVVITGSSIDSIKRQNKSSSSGYINLPRYPNAYPTAITQNFTLTNVNSSGFVRLTFDDFHINHRSLLQIIDGEEVIFDTKISKNYRPRPIQSKGPSLRITFSANYFTGQGFKAKYAFIDSDKWMDRPINCDEFFENYGGRISLNNKEELVGTYVDCIWIVSNSPSFTRTFDHIYLRVEEYQLKGQLQFEIRSGTYSEAKRVLMLFEPQTTNQLIRKQPSNGFIVDSKTANGFYIRLRGFLASTNGLSIVYSQFYSWTGICLGEDEFLCDNSRCIKREFHCDLLNSCGDSSDEICNIKSSLFEESNFDIPALLALVIGIIGLIIILVAIFIILTRFGKQKIAFLRNNDRVLMSFLRNGRSSFIPQVTTNNDITNNAHLPTISSTSELAASIHTIGERRFYVLPENQIHVIEAPPTYSDALKHPPIVPSYTNGAFQDIELNRTGHSLPKVSTSSTSPARINVECSDEPGPSHVLNNEIEDSPETESKKEENDLSGVESWV